eukprot:2024199-Rhodomonas_salina.1
MPVRSDGTPLRTTTSDRGATVPLTYLVCDKCDTSCQGIAQEFCDGFELRIRGDGSNVRFTDLAIRLDPAL